MITVPKSPNLDILDSKIDIFAVSSSQKFDWGEEKDYLRSAAVMLKYIIYIPHVKFLKAEKIVYNLIISNTQVRYEEVN